MQKWLKPLRKNIAEAITAIWDFTAGLKAAKIGIGQAPGTELLEIAKDTDVSAIVGRAKIGFINAAFFDDCASFAHIDKFTSNSYCLQQDPAGNSYVNCANGAQVFIRHNNSNVAIFSSTGLALQSAKTITTVYVSDVDSDTDDVLSTGITTKFGLVLIKETVDKKFCLFRIKGDNSIPIIVDGDAEFAAVKDNPATYNFYYETDQFKLQNKVGDNKALYVGLYLV